MYDSSLVIHETSRAEPPNGLHLWRFIVYEPPRVDRCV
ncbi:hypothetical protein T11_16853 [Trichinella zimbabwensis]|uniref:Uncharacterized protein n=1 Tax=Trichinella zimbabwensis TaxID=268475 RepID=A0A0V1FMR4_9BILA|nr:hypothetical protein T11_12357 [Trichinella zimbabwensis]KRY87246.1 hypothetical protein T11_16853 [Trichinella zimbabwensis]